MSAAPSMQDPAAASAALLADELATYCRDVIASQALAFGDRIGPDPVVSILARADLVRRLAHQAVATYEDPKARAQVAELLRGHFEEGIVHGLADGRA